MSMEKFMFNLKFSAKELERNSKKCLKEESQEKLKCKKAIQKGNMEDAKIHAENAIRQKHQSLNYLRMSARVDAVACRVQTAVSNKKVTQSISGVTKAMDSAMRTMDLEKFSQILDKFEKQFQDLDIQIHTMENSISSSTTEITPEFQVDSLMQEMADEAGLDLNIELPSARNTKTESKSVSEHLEKLRHLQTK